VVRDAHYESQQRTVGVSQKPAIGKTLFSDVLIQSTGGPLHGHFDTERFLHSQVRGYTLRAAAHWNEARSVAAEVARSENIVCADQDQIADVPQVQTDVRSPQSDLKMRLALRRVAAKAGVQALIAVIASQLTMKTAEALKSSEHNTSEAKTRSQKYTSGESSAASKGRRVSGFEISRAEGFGTAPVWYQQSMQNGPPVESLAG